MSNAPNFNTGQYAVCSGEDYIEIYCPHVGYINLPLEEAEQFANGILKLVEWLKCTPKE